MSRDSRLARIERLEARLVVELPAADLPLNRVEVAELAELQREYSSRFPADVDDMSMAELDDFLGWHAGEQAARMAHLADRARPPQQRAEDRALALAINSMDLETLDLFMAEMSSGERSRSCPP